MIESTYNLVDEKDLSLVSSVKVPRRIRTKKSSFSSIKATWTNFLKARLDKMKDKALEANIKLGSGSRITDKQIRKIDKMTGPIARLEAKLSIIGADLNSKKEQKEVIKKRAIRLRDNMIANLQFNSNNAYSVGLDKKDKVFATEEVIEHKVEEEDSFGYDESVAMKSATETSQEQVEAIMKEEQEKLAQEVKEIIPTSDEKEVKKATEEEVKVEPVVEDTVREMPVVVTDLLGKEEIKDTIDEKLVEAKEKVETSEQVLGKTDLKNVVTDELNKITEEKEEEESLINPDEIKEELEAVFRKISADNGMPKARVEMYDDNGERKLNPNEVEEVKIEEVNHVDEKKEEETDKKNRYTYTPMTDEEIAQARENIEYEKYEEKYANEHKKSVSEKEKKYNYKPMSDEEIANARENIGLNIPKITFDKVFTPAKNAGKAIYTATSEENKPVIASEEKEDGMHFDYSKATPKDVNRLVDKITDFKDLAAMRKRVIELQEQQMKSKLEAEKAERLNAEAKAKAEEAVKSAEAKRKSYAAKEEKLRLYIEALEEDYKFNKDKTASAMSEVEHNRQIIEEKSAEVRELDERENEINSMLSPEAINVRIVDGGKGR